MKKVAVIFDVHSNNTENLTAIIKKKYEVVEVFSLGEMKKMLIESFDSFSAIIIDHPSTQEGFDEFLKFVDSKNSYMFSLPVLIATDDSTMKEDGKMLRRPVLDVVFTEDYDEIVFNRIENAIRLANSTSFDDFSIMLKALPSLIYIKDNKGRYAFSSQDWHHQLEGSIVRGKTDLEIRKDKQNARFAMETDFEVIKTGRGKSYVIKEDDDEGIDYLKVIKEPLKDNKGDVYGIIAIVNNVTDEEILRQQLREKSITDQLTGLYNRMYFEELTHWQGDELEFPLTIISADCDGLKCINDEFGHSAGDKYICFARDALKEALPDESYIFRMGGDEFLVVIPNTDEEQAEVIVNAVNEIAKKYKNKDFALELSVGSATIKNPKISIETAVRMSDKEMYRIKRERKTNSK